MPFSTTSSFVWSEAGTNRELRRLALLSAAHTLDVPFNAHTRRMKRSRNLELIIRCAFFLTRTPKWLLHHNASLEIHAAKGVAHFPLSRGVPLPRSRASRNTLAEAEAGYPTAPWNISNSITRATDLMVKQIRVGMWCTKKYTWNPYHDELWLLWILDVVGVDHVVLHIASLDLSFDYVKQRLARHEGLYRSG